MASVKQVTILGDSVLKGIQIDLSTQRYRTNNRIDIPALEKEFGVSVRNDAHFGATVRKGEQLLERMLERGAPCDILVMDFGGNDCDYRWREIAENPTGRHLPNVPLAEFVERYRRMLRRARSRGIEPIVTTLPPLHAEKFFKWWCGELDRDAVLRWLGDVQNIYSWQERYSRAVERLAREEDVPLVDVRGAFLDHGHIETLLCADGTHPNSEGQQVITQAFREFGLSWRAAKRAV
ncbi:MAG: SGNH/GDSL hydrolase family protein [Oscillibacter sp.]|nr:SGNH/GDSL hydrolase family protein [Oscillibacter sp.]